MNANDIVQMIAVLGPVALDLAPKLANVWHKESLTPDEVLALCAPAKKTYDEGIAEVRARLTALGIPLPPLGQVVV